MLESTSIEIGEITSRRQNSIFFKSLDKADTLLFLVISGLFGRFVEWIA